MYANVSMILFKCWNEGTFYCYNLTYYLFDSLEVEESFTVSSH